MKDLVGVILAAGFGTRLRPATLRCPKPLIPVAGVEPLFVAISQAYHCGIRRLIVNAHYLPEQIIRSLKEWAELFSDLDIRVSLENEGILGTGGGLIKIIRDHQDWVSGSALLIQNGDTLGCFSFFDLIENRLIQSKFAISLEKSFLKKYHPLWVDSANFFWTGIGSASPHGSSLPAHFLGVHCLSASVVEEIFKRENLFSVRNVDLFNGVYRPLTELGFSFEATESLGGRDSFCENAFWFDMTDESFLLEAQAFIFGHLYSGSRWHQILRERYPHIREIFPRVFVEGEALDPQGNWEAPLVFVSKGCVNFVGAGREINCGPNLSLVSRRPLEFSFLRGKKLRNCSILVDREGPSEASGEWDDSFEGKVRVL